MINVIIGQITCLKPRQTNIPHCVFLFGRHCGMTAFYTGINKEKACHQQKQIRPTHNDEMSGPNPGVGDKRVVSVLNHMLLSLCSITHVPCVKQTTAILYVTCIRGKQEFSEDWEQMTSIPIATRASPHEIRTQETTRYQEADFGESTQEP